MQIVRFAVDHKPRWGILEGDEVTPIRGLLSGKMQRAAGIHRLAEVRLLCPVDPSKVVAVGLNYRDHAKEVNQELPSEPFIFLKAPTSLVGPDEQIVIANPENETHHEAELAVVIGRTAKNVSPADALDYVLGYTCANDVSDRTIQRREASPVRAKSFDTYTPVGPAIVTGVTLSRQSIECLVNCATRQRSSVDQLIFDVPAVISFVSASMTLLPGDVILTGTPAGIGPLKGQDSVEVRIEGIGSLRNTVR